MLSENIKSRLEFIDIARGLAMVLVVMWHCAAPFGEFFRPFRMPFFFVLSGYLFKSYSVVNVISLIGYIFKLVKKLWFPFFFWTTLTLWLHNFFVRIYIYSNNPKFNNLFGSHHNKVIGFISVQQRLHQTVQAMLFNYGTQVEGALWFLGVLFEGLVVFSFVKYALKKLLNNDDKEDIVIMTLAIGSIFLSFAYPRMASFDSRCLTAFYLISLGYFIKKNNWTIRVGVHNNFKSIVIKVIGLFLILLFVCKIGSVDISNNKFQNPYYITLASMCGWYFIINIAKIIEKSKILGSCLKLIGRHTMSIIIFHFISFKIVNYICVIINDYPRYYIASFPTISIENAYLWPVYLMAGIFIPILFDCIWVKMKQMVSFNIFYVDNNKQTITIIPTLQKDAKKHINL